jgi:hypothetical protein
VQTDARRVDEAVAREHGKVIAMLPGERPS